MREICPKRNCTGCGCCANICPAKCISMKEDAEGFLFPYIIEDECIHCNLCEKKCPANSLSAQNVSTFYMAWHRNPEVVLESSSGGVFTGLAEYVIRRKGVVFGAVKDNQSRIVYHCGTKDRGGLSKMRLSKYYQSKTGDTYKEVKKYLNNGTQVLYTGTACQIAGLYSYLGNTGIDNLITSDVLCHGVASKKVVDQYIISKEKQFKKEILEISFRVKDKKVGWSGGGGTRMKIDFKDGASYVSEKGYDTFFTGFNRNDFLRESCYKCKYCGTKRIADFTMADFWGCDSKRLPDGQMKLGVSLLLCNSEKAKGILEELEGDLVIEPIDSKEAIPYNRALSKPQYRPASRDRFFVLMERKGFDRSIKQLHPERFIRYRVKVLLKMILPRRIARKIIKSMD